MNDETKNVGVKFCIPLILAIALFASGCTTTYPARSPLGERFPSVRAMVLNGEEVEIPHFFKGKDTLLLIGFIQDTQFDIDRWLLALKQLRTPVVVAEIPAIQGLFPRMISTKINQGMKEGIPQEDWQIVFTVYKDADKIAQFVGNTKPRNVRVVLIDKDGVVRWFHDRGFSSDRAIELDKLIRESLDKVGLGGSASESFDSLSGSWRQSCL